MVLFFIKYDAMKMCGGMVVRLYQFLIYYKTLSSELHTQSTFTSSKPWVDLFAIVIRGVLSLPGIEL